MGIVFNLEKYNFNEQKEIDVSLITVDQAVREICKQNKCGQYGTNHMCPPAIKSITDWKEEILVYQKALIVTKVYPTAGSFDLKTWLESMADFQKILLRVKRDFQKKFPEKNILLLGAGSCRLCERCTCTDGEPCRLPEEAIPSMEACGIDVMSLSKQIGIRYNNGKNKVTYIGAVLYK